MSYDLINALKRLAVPDRHRCFGCGMEHLCSIHGCRIIKDAVAEIERLRSDLTEAVKDLALSAECDTCAHERLVPDPACEETDYCCSDCRNTECVCRDCYDGSRWQWEGLGAGG